MIAQDIKNGEGVAFIDPHGNDIEDVLASVPPERAERRHLFRSGIHGAADGPQHARVRPQRRPEMKTFVVDEVYGIFRKLYADVPEAFGPMFEQYYRNAVQLVVEDPDSGSTFVEVPRVLCRPQFRELKALALQQSGHRTILAQDRRASAGRSERSKTSRRTSPRNSTYFSPTTSCARSSRRKNQLLISAKSWTARKSFSPIFPKAAWGDRNTSLLGLVLVSKFLQAAFHASTRAMISDLLPLHRRIPKLRDAFYLHHPFRSSKIQTLAHDRAPIHRAAR
jgi:hypothetical protein